RLPRGLVGIAWTLEDLERPEPEREQAEDGERAGGEDPDTDVEAATAEEARVRGGDRLGDRPHARQRPGQAHGAPLAARGRDEAAADAFAAVVERAQLDSIRLGARTRVVARPSGCRRYARSIRGLPGSGSVLRAVRRAARDD